MPNPAEEKGKSMQEKGLEGAIIYTVNTKVQGMPMTLQEVVMAGLVSIAAFFINPNHHGDTTLPVQ
jgi:hypothetical protein